MNSIRWKFRDLHCTGYTPPPVAGAQQRRECHAALSASADFLLDLFRDRGRAKPKTNHSSKEAGERQLPRAAGWPRRRRGGRSSVAGSAVRGAATPPPRSRFHASATALLQRRQSLLLDAGRHFPPPEDQFISCSILRW